MKSGLKILFLPVVIINILLISCIDENINNISESLEINSSYSIPIGNVTYSINEYFEMLDFYGLDTIQTDTLQTDTIQALPGDSIGLVEYEDTLYTNVRYTVDTLIYTSFDFSSLGDDLSKIRAITFVSIIKNDFPTETKVQVYFAGESMDIIDSLFSDGPYSLPPPDLDNEGIPVDHPSDIVITPVSEYLIENLASIRHIIMYGYVRTLRPDIDISKFYSYYLLSIHIAARIELEFNTSEF
jgi:hypothetical protein